MRASAAVLLAACVLATALAGCAEAPAPAPHPQIAPPQQPAASGDGVLRIGTLFSSTGSFASYADAQVAGVELAVREVNAAGGVAGRSVEVFHRNAGDGGAPATAALGDLVEKGADVIVGPTVTSTATAVLADPAAAAVLILTPGFLDAGNAEDVVAARLFRRVAEVGTPTRANDDFLERLARTDPGLRDTTFAAEAYDATIAAVLAAILAGDDGATSVAWALPEVTVAGFGCTDVGVCRDAIGAAVDIDYGGVSGPLDVHAPGSGHGSVASGNPPGAASD